MPPPTRATRRPPRRLRRRRAARQPRERRRPKQQPRARSVARRAGSEHSGVPGASGLVCPRTGHWGGHLSPSAHVLHVHPSSICSHHRFRPTSMGANLSTGRVAKGLVDIADHQPSSTVRVGRHVQPGLGNEDGGPRIFSTVRGSQARARASVAVRFLSLTARGAAARGAVRPGAGLAWPRRGLALFCCPRPSGRAGRAVPR
mmetsp:Transcript_13019/g.34742  ORF Transcript_13019/g.34742 Transcript_13019/m.34742 type:complete len:202 (+) Transcript_13019:732-1337(+)